MATIERPISFTELETLVHDTTLFEEERHERIRKESEQRRHQEILASLELPEETLSPEKVYRIIDEIGLKRENVNTIYALRHPELGIAAEPSPHVQAQQREERFRGLMTEYGMILQQRIDELPKEQFRLTGDLKYRHVAADHTRDGHEAHTIRKATFAIEERMERRFLWDKHLAVAQILIDDSDSMEGGGIGRAYVVRVRLSRDPKTKRLIYSDEPKTERAVHTDIYRPSFSLFEDTYNTFITKAREEFRIKTPVRHF